MTDDAPDRGPDSAGPAGPAGPAADAPAAAGPLSTPLFSTLDRRGRRRLFLRALLRITAVTALLIVVYAVFPVGLHADGTTWLVLAGGIAAFLVALTYQVRRIVASPMPQLRAIETLATVVPLFIIVFSLVYVGLSQNDPASFSEPITKVGGIYFTVTILSTVGFGDITATTDTTRLVVTLQMLIDLLIIGVLVKLIIGASRIGVQRRQAEAAAQAQATRPDA
ncbi:MAG: ion channel [Acidimicrobiales bacterium]